MRSWKSLALVAAAVWCAVVISFCVRPSSGRAGLRVPTGAPAAAASVSCGPAWGTGYVHVHTDLPYPYTGSPCAGRRSIAIMGGVDVALTVVVFGTLIGWRYRRPVARTRPGWQATA